MSAFILPRENAPLFYLGEFPVRLITLLVALHSATMIAAALLLAAGYGAQIDALAYSSSAVAHGQVWRLLTYAFVATPSIWFLFEMLMLYYFGREVENGLGWRRFGILYAGLLLLGPMLLQGFSYAGIPQSSVGAQEVNFAVFAAFVAMHPGAQFFFGLAARWVFVGLLAISSLQMLADHQATRVLVLVCSSVLAIQLMRRSGFEEPLFGWSFSLSLPSFKQRQDSFSVLNGGLAASSQKTTTTGHEAKAGKIGKLSMAINGDHIDPEMVMDSLLEKISNKGMTSLSAEERSSLEQARQAILARGTGGTPR